MSTIGKLREPSNPVGGVALGAPKAVKHFLSAEKDRKNHLYIKENRQKTVGALRGAEATPPTEFDIIISSIVMANTRSNSYLSFLPHQKKDPDLHVTDPLLMISLISPSRIDLQSILPQPAGAACVHHALHRNDTEICCIRPHPLKVFSET